MSPYERDCQILEWTNTNRIKVFDNLLVGITDTAYMVALLIGLLVLISGFMKKDTLLRRKGWEVLGALLANSVIVNVLKYTINRERPFVQDKLIEKLSTGGSPSFPSGHTADAFVVATSMSLLFYPKWQLLVPIWIWAIAIGYSRIVLGVHYPSDVLGSMVIGSMIAVVIHFLIKKRKADKVTILIE